MPDIKRARRVVAISCLSSLAVLYVAGVMGIHRPLTTNEVVAILVCGLVLMAQAPMLVVYIDRVVANRKEK